MDNNDQLPIRFLSFVVANDCRADSLYLPLSFCAKYGECIPGNVTLTLRNGDEIDVQFRNDLGVFVGMRKFFEQFDCRHGCIMAFQFNGGHSFFAHVVTSSFEIYGDIVDDAGCKFLKIMLQNSLPGATLTLPRKFVKRFGKHIPRKVTLCFRNGKRIECGYDKCQKMLFGMEEMLRITSLGLFDMILFTYYGAGLFDVSIFNVKCVEKPLVSDQCLLEPVLNKFEVRVQHSHLLRYCLGVCISVRFRPLTDKWQTVDYLKVHYRKICFTLEIKKRHGKVEIHQGWVQLRTYLKLKKGDLCVFNAGSSDRHFDLEVFK